MENNLWLKLTLQWAKRLNESTCLQKEVENMDNTTQELKNLTDSLHIVWWINVEDLPSGWTLWISI